ncbi:Protein of unknown function [Pyronema omphalodes CBS 100304]|uniref:Uncharacterized protein n=1 Tax=Pyronema omphalodes (strain CBS 100304) TaxID=1076935 RepID=U4LRZ0_PYROM|nr:Protein of unknown function [Pyronema omphalodes CBS 100304]
MQLWIRNRFFIRHCFDGLPNKQNISSVGKSFMICRYFAGISV